ncbi:membrane protein [Marinobacterium nitratireducens]|uniref:Membrane protein n=1 Tax=Marinobacterium nitratireducens TaxID=518897 RepID=A0A917Z875_9GAMM|nr:YjgN family protein [Marinobacterium nitratireducens]GGO77967.1 membrane protein [Marinobacterium nitratireducens]
MDSTAPVPRDCGQAATRRLSFEFSGDSREYFRIWILNLFLSLLTLGIYSAWAKVRSERYFYGHTRLDGSSFEYTASPISILKGRLVALAVVLLYSFVSSQFPLTAPLFAVAFMFAMPWLVVRSLRFRHDNSRYRGIRFGFDGRYPRALIWYLLAPIGSVLTVFLAYPYVACRQQQWLVRNSRFGDARFDTDLGTSSVYGVYIVGGGIALLGIVLQGLAANFIPAGAGQLLLPLLSVPFYYLAFVFVDTQMTNLTLNHASLDEHRFESRMETAAVCRLLITNTLGIMLSLGLLIPWAKIRMARYRAECTGVLFRGEPDRYIQTREAEQNAFGEELGEALDIEVGL